MRVTLRRLKWPELLRVQAWAALWTAFLILALSPVVHSATSTWNGGNTTSGNWTSTDNWVGGSIPSSTNSLVFSGTSNTLTNDNLASLFSVLGVTFAAGASPFALSGNSITLTGSIVNISTVLQTINLNIVQNSTQTYSTGVATTGGPGLIGLGDLMINGVISGTGGITKDSSVLWPAGTTKLILTGNNTFTGITSILRGTVSVATIGDGGQAGNLGAASSSAANLVFTVGAGNYSALQYTGLSASTNRSFTITTSGAVGGFDIANSATNLTLTGSSAATGGIFAKNGGGTLTLTHAMGHTGGTAINSGTLALDFTAAGAPASNILSSGTALNFGSSFTKGGYGSGSATLKIIGSSSSSNIQTFGTLSVLPANSSLGIAAHLNILGNATVYFSSLAMGADHEEGPTLDIATGANGRVAFTGPVSISNGLLNGNANGYAPTLNGTDWATLSNINLAGTYGMGNVVAAAYTAGTNSGAYSGSANIDVVANVVQNGGANTLRFNQAAGYTVTYNNSLTTRGILVTSNVGANDVSVLAGGAGWGIQGNGRSIEVIQNNTAGNLTISGINAGGGVVGLNKAGAGRLILSGNNTYNGETMVNEGILQISSNSNLGAVDQNHSGTMANGTAFQPQSAQLYLSATLEARGNSGNVITLDGQGSVNGIYAREIVLGQGAPVIDVAAGITLAATGGINPSWGGGGQISLSPALTKTGSGNLILSGVNNSNGGLVVNAGKVFAPFSTSGTNQSVTALGTFWSSGGAFQAFSSGASTINVTASGSIAGISTGMVIIGTGIQNGTTVASVNATTSVITLSQNTTANSSGNYGFFTYGTNATFSSGSSTITVANATGIQIGEQVFSVDPNLISTSGIAYGSVVTGVAGNVITLSQNTTSTTGNNTMFVFGGTAQYAVASTAGLGLGATLGGTNFQGAINGIQGNIVSATYSYTGNFTTANMTTGASDSLGTGFVTVNGGTLDLGGITHQPIGGSSGKLMGKRTGKELVFG